MQLTRQQKIDFLALMHTGEKHRSVTTKSGERNIIDVTFMDGSKLANGKMVTNVFPEDESRRRGAPTIAGT